jgi:hypothetical protein
MPKKLPSLPPFGSLKLRKTLSAPGLLERVRNSFSQVNDHRKTKPGYPLADVLMSGLALFSLKDGSLLQFDQQRGDKARRHNLKSLFGIGDAPCDSQMRTVLDGVKPQHLRPAFRSLHQELQRQGIQESYRFLGKYLVSADGTGIFSSGDVCCPDCCLKTHKDGRVEYYHQMLGAVLVHPDKPAVLPFFPEAITRQDGVQKNDCEHNASKRLIPRLREDFPRLEMILLQDALSCNGPHIRLLQSHGYSFIITAKAASNSLLLKTVVAGLQDGSTQELAGKTAKGLPCGYRYANNIPLNHDNQDVKVNYIDYWEERPDGTTFIYDCVTDIPLTADNVADVVRAGRSRWKVENETFNTLKNLGYNLEHNYGHGKQHLSTVFATLMMLAFLIDQIQEACCQYFRAARARFHTRTALWEKMRGMFREHLIGDWEAFYAAIIWGYGRADLMPKGIRSG